MIPSYRQSRGLILAGCFAVALLGCDTSNEFPEQLVVTNRYIGAGVRQDKSGNAFAEFEHTEATDGRLLKLQEVAELKSVRLIDTDATEGGVAYLSKLKRIEIIAFENCPGIGDEAMKHLPLQSPVKELTVVGTQLTDAGVQHIARVRTLEILTLGGVSAAAFEPLKSLPNLHTLSLVHSQIDDAAVDHLAQLTHLQYLAFVSCDLPEPVEVRLRSALPHARIATE